MSEKKQRPRRRKQARFAEFSGTVVIEPIYEGSKSERMAVKLDIGDHKLLLRRVGIRSYRDEELEKLVGKTITCHGLERAGRLYVKDFTPE
ncbi:MAG TPA: hypothetical protein VIV14_00720 [Gammaproteobacteria bacterium]